MDVLTLLIADGDETFRHALCQALQDSCYVRACGSGTRAMQLLQTSQVHILLVDLMLPELDGLTLLEELSRQGICPEVLAVAPDLPEEANARMEELEIRSFLRKPFPLEAAVEKIRLLRQELESRDLLQRRVRQLLCQLHMRPDYDGYTYIVYCLPLLIEDPDLCITKHLYVDTARAFSCRPKSVEHSIRNAIAKTWEKHHSPLWQTYFPNHTKRPTNGDFLQALALEIRKDLE